MDRAISWRMKGPAYAPTTASSSPSRNRCKTRCPSWNATGRRKTFPYAYPDSRVRRSLLRGRQRGERSFWVNVRTRGGAIKDPRQGSDAKCDVCYSDRRTLCRAPEENLENLGIDTKQSGL